MRRRSRRRSRMPRARPRGRCRAARAASVPRPLIQVASNDLLVPKTVKTIAITPAAPANATVAATAAAPASETITAAAVTPTSATAERCGGTPDAATTFAERVAAFPSVEVAAKAPEAPLFQSLYQSDQRGAGRAGRARAVGPAPCRRRRDARTRLRRRRTFRRSARPARPLTRRSICSSSCGRRRAGPA